MPTYTQPLFLKKLVELTSAVPPEIAEWAPDGNSFMIKSTEKYEKFLLKYYKGNLTTFVRQLHFYGFRKIDIKGTQWSFSHKSFKRDAPHLVYEIRRKTRKENPEATASQIEVQTLRSHVDKLSSTVSNLRGELAESETTVTRLKLELQELKHRFARMEKYFQQQQQIPDLMYTSVNTNHMTTNSSCAACSNQEVVPSLDGSFLSAQSNCNGTSNAIVGGATSLLVNPIGKKEDKKRKSCDISRGYTKDEEKEQNQRLQRNSNLYEHHSSGVNLVNLEEGYEPNEFILPFADEVLV